jgi:hypothetical protein
MRILAVSDLRTQRLFDLAAVIKGAKPDLVVYAGDDVLRLGGVPDRVHVGLAPGLRYDLTPESGSLWASTRPRPCSKPLADVLTTVMVGLATGLATVALVHLLEHLDLFGVEGDRCHAFVMERLDAEIEALFERGDEVVEAMG